MGSARSKRTKNKKTRRSNIMNWKLGEEHSQQVESHVQKGVSTVVASKRMKSATMLLASVVISSVGHVVSSDRCPWSMIIDGTSLHVHIIPQYMMLMKRQHTGRIVQNVRRRQDRLVVFHVTMVIQSPILERIFVMPFVAKR